MKFMELVCVSRHRVVGRVTVLCITVAWCLVIVRLVKFMVGFWCSLVRCECLLTSGPVLTFVSLFANENMVA